MAGMKVLIVGAGGREHALAIGLSESPSVESIHTCPGNAGTSMLGINHNVSATDVDAIVKLATKLSVDLVVVGPEAPLVSGLSDSLRDRGIPSFGPHSEGAELEGSKLHAKQVMEELGIPTGGVQILQSDSDIDAALSRYSPPWVIKRDVLAAGKGVEICNTLDEARESISKLLKSGEKIIIEDFIRGIELSSIY